MSALYVTTYYLLRYWDSIGIWTDDYELILCTLKYHKTIQLITGHRINQKSRRVQIWLSNSANVTRINLFYSSDVRNIICRTANAWPSFDILGIAVPISISTRDAPSVVMITFPVYVNTSAANLKEPRASDREVQSSVQFL